MQFEDRYLGSIDLILSTQTQNYCLAFLLLVRIWSALDFGPCSYWSSQGQAAAMDWEGKRMPRTAFQFVSVYYVISFRYDPMKNGEVREIRREREKLKIKNSQYPHLCFIFSLDFAEILHNIRGYISNLIVMSHHYEFMITYESFDMNILIKMKMNILTIYLFWPEYWQFICCWMQLLFQSCLRNDKETQFFLWNLSFSESDVVVK